MQVVPLNLDTAIAAIGDTPYPTLQAAIDAAKSADNHVEITLKRNTTVASATLNALFDAESEGTAKDYTINLGENKLTITGGTGIGYDYSTLTIKNGELEAKGYADGTRGVICPGTEATLNLEDVKMETNGSALFPCADTSAVNVERSEIIGGTYTVSTNASVNSSGALTQSKNVKITLKDSKFSTTGYQNDDGDTCTVMINVPGAMTIEGCEIYGKRQAMLVRGGEVIVKNSTIESDLSYGGDGHLNKYLDGSWSSGNEVPEYALVVGNRSAGNAYNYSAICTLENTDVIGGIYTYGNSTTNTATLTIDGPSGCVNDSLVKGENTTLTIKNGMFSFDPSEYLTEGYYMVASNNGDYPYAVELRENPPSAPIIVKDRANASVADGIDSNCVDTSAVQVDGVAEALKDGKALLVYASRVDTTDAVKTEVEVSVDVTLTKVDQDTLTFTAKPIATVKVTKNNEDGTNQTETKEDVTVPNYMLRGDITVKLPLPENFTPLQIKHTSENGYIEYFINETVGAKRGAKTFVVDENNCAVFTITHFSTFELSTDLTYVEPVYTGGGSSSAATYSIDAAKTENGSITVSPKSASKGTVVTITATPDKGYELDTLTALDKDGKSIKLTEKNGKYIFEMPDSKVTVKASFKKIAVVNPFVDVKTGDYFYDAVLWAVEKDITSGTSAATFSPNEPCTRGQIVTFLWRAAGSPEAKNAASFADVNADSYYAKAVAWAVENGITKGTSETTFSPDATCTRAQAVTFLSRALKGTAAAGNTFSDVDADSYYAEAVAWAVANDITNGTSATTFSPDEVCTRGQIVTFLFRAMAE